MANINSPLKIGSNVLKNRITFAPTVKFWAGTDGIAFDRFAAHYEDRAKGGAGLICVEATCVTPDGRLSPTQLGLWNDAQIPGHRKITDACHRHGTVVMVQIHHGGYNTHPECGPSKGPSVVTWRDRTTEALTHDEIAVIVEQFIQAAVRAHKAGYDGVQLHACHAYLINQFISPIVNQRTDEYGGSTENRARFGCEIIRGIRKACGNDFIISPRTSGAEPTLEEAWAIADAYIDAGADYLQVSNGIGPEEVPYPEYLPYSRIVYIGTQMHAHVDGRVPVSVVGGIVKPETARMLIEQNLADTVDSAKALLADPNWAAAVAEDTPYVECRSCKVCFWSPFMPHKCPAVAVRHKTDPACADYFE